MEIESVTYYFEASRGTWFVSINKSQILREFHSREEALAYLEAWSDFIDYQTLTFEGEKNELN